MNHPISYEMACARYPKQVAEIAVKIAKLKKKAKKPAGIHGLQWSLSWCVQVEALTFASFAQSLVRPPAPVLEKTEDEEVLEYQQRCHIGLRAGRFSSDTKLDTLPEEIEIPFRERIRERKAEDARCAALTPEQRHTEMEELLKDLRKDPGFFELGVVNAGD